MKNLDDKSWNHEKAEMLFIVYTRSIINGGILNIINNDTDIHFKDKIIKDFKNICLSMLKGYRTYNYDLMLESVTMLTELYDYINKNNLYIYKEDKNDKRIFQKCSTK